MNSLTKQISKYLKSLGFKEENLVWTFSREIESPGATLIINGQRMQQPGQKMQVEVVVEAIEGGSIKTVDKEDLEELTQVVFRVKHGESHGEFEECLYNDDFIRFKQIMQEIL